MSSFLEGILREKIGLERTQKMQAIARRNVTVGRVIYSRQGHHVQDMWCEGDEYQKLRYEQARVKRDREELERQKKELVKLFRKAKAARTSAHNKSTSSSSGALGTSKDARGNDNNGTMRPPSVVILSGAEEAEVQWARLVECVLLNFLS